LRDIESPGSRGTRVVYWSRRAEKPGTVLFLVCFLRPLFLALGRRAAGPTAQPAPPRGTPTAVVTMGIDLSPNPSERSFYFREKARCSRDAREMLERRRARSSRTALVVVSTPRIGTITRRAASFALGNRSISGAPCLLLCTPCSFSARPRPARPRHASIREYSSPHKTRSNVSSLALWSRASALGCAHHLQRDVSFPRFALPSVKRVRSLLELKGAIVYRLCPLLLRSRVHI
jgi:hypothetical protein